MALFIHRTSSLIVEHRALRSTREMTNSPGTAWEHFVDYNRRAVRRETDLCAEYDYWPNSAARSDRTRDALDT